MSCAITPNNAKLVIVTENNELLFYDLRQGRPINRLRLDGTPLFLHLLPGNKLALVGHWNGRKISLLDLYGNRFIRSVFVAGAPTYFGQFGKEILVLLSREQKVAFLSGYSFRPLKEVVFDAAATGLAVAARRQRAYVAVGMRKVAVVDLASRKLVRTFDLVTARDTPLVIDPAERWLFALSPRNSVVRVSLEEEKENKRISTGSGPSAMGISADGKYLYATNGLEGKLAIFDAENLTQLDQVSVGVRPSWVTISHDDRYVLVCNRGSRTISILERMAASQ
ncbi:MAG TPA: beta-propeller fold lactonase family protein [Acidobacteriota bacterium]|nr:beta-propeller fold lactonase family protein [Acidobacteriota bacterium]